MVDELIERLPELRALEAAATKGPWHIGKPFRSDGPGARGNQITPIYAPQDGCSQCGRGVGQWLISWLFKNAVAETQANAALIVAARNALPDLLTRIEQLTAERDGLREALEWALDNAGHPHYPMRSDTGGWEYPYLVSGTPMGGGVGYANFYTALDAVEHARTALTSLSRES